MALLDKGNEKLLNLSWNSLHVGCTAQISQIASQLQCVIGRLKWKQNRVEAGSLVVRHGRDNGFDLPCQMMGSFIEDFHI
jgi:hypothetical protein